MKKRKIKLLASLTSLVLVVAVMAVGVWAATSVTLGVTSNASFTASGIAGNVQISQTAVTEAGNIASAAIGGGAAAALSTTPTDVDTFNLDTAQNAALKAVVLTLAFNDSDDDGFLNTDENITVNFIFNNTGTWDYTVAWAITDNSGTVRTTATPATSPVTVTKTDGTQTIAFTFAVIANHSATFAGADLTGPTIAFTLAKA